LEVLTAASSGFMVESVESIEASKESESEGDVKQLTIPQVKLTYWMSWSDFDIDTPPAMILLELRRLVEGRSSIFLSTAIVFHSINFWSI
jgi:hypothetical protein